ncbi:hypothetical protein BJY59DRAFT_684892, partial [Rhodotorula toruloides]
MRMKQALNTRIPPRNFVCTPTSTELAAIAAGERVRLTPPLTQRVIRPDEIGGREAAIPLTIEPINETEISYFEAVRRQMAGYFSNARQHPHDYLHLPPTLYRPEELGIEPTTYYSEAQLGHWLSQDLIPSARSLSDIDGDIWTIGPDTAGNRANMWPVTSADLVLSRWLGGGWEGAASAIKAVLDETLEEGRTKALAMGVYPCMVNTTGGTPNYWDERSGMLRPLDATLRFLVHINSIMTSQIRRSQHAGVENPYIPLIITNGSVFFVVLGRLDIIDGEAYGRLGFTRMESLANYPLRLLFFAHALMHRLNPTLPPPPGFSLDEALKSTIQPSVAFKSQAKAEEALRALEMAKRASDKSGAKGNQESDGTEAGRSGGTGGRAGGVAGGGEARGGRHFPLSSLLATRLRAKDIQVHSHPSPCHAYPADSCLLDSRKKLALPLRFELVVAWWGEGRGRSDPTTFELATARDSQPATDHVPTVVLDKLLSKVDSLSVAKSTALNLVFKKAWVADERATELLNEGAIFDELYRQDDAADFLVGYAGFFESTNESHYLPVTEAGEALEDWRKESDAVIEIVEQLHQRGYVHGDLAERNVVRTPAGLRLIDLGRARRAEGHECAREMEQLKKVLAGEADWLVYSFLGY